MANLVYVDNSNVWIEGKHVSAVQKHMVMDVFDAQKYRICDNEWGYDFGKLLHFAGGKKEDIKRAVLFGSRPPRNDTLWAIAEKKGFEVVVYDRNYQNKEKKIDTDVVATIMEDSFTILDIPNDEIVLIAGDKDYVPLIEKLKKRNVKVAVCFWEHAAQELKDICSEFVSLNPHIETIRL